MFSSSMKVMALKLQAFSALNPFLGHYLWVFVNPHSSDLFRPPLLPRGVIQSLRSFAPFFTILSNVSNLALASNPSQVALQ